MTATQLSALLLELLALPNVDETEWVEFKHNNDNPDLIGEYLSALANSAALHRRETGYMIWGVEDGTKAVLGTSFKPRRANWPSSAGTSIGALAVAGWRATLSASGARVDVGVLAMGAGAQAARSHVTAASLANVLKC